MPWGTGGAILPYNYSRPAGVSGWVTEHGHRQLSTGIYLVRQLGGSWNWTLTQSLDYGNITIQDNTFNGTYMHAYVVVDKWNTTDNDVTVNEVFPSDYFRFEFTDSFYNGSILYVNRTNPIYLYEQANYWGASGNATWRYSLNTTHFGTTVDVNSSSFIDWSWNWGGNVVNDSAILSLRQSNDNITRTTLLHNLNSTHKSGVFQTVHEGAYPSIIFNCTAPAANVSYWVSNSSLYGEPVGVYFNGTADTTHWNFSSATNTTILNHTHSSEVDVEIVYLLLAPPTVDLANISDLEGCGAWVFANEKYYTFNAYVSDANGYADIDTVKLNFTTNRFSRVVAAYNGSRWNLEGVEEDYPEVRLRAGSATAVDADTLLVTFLLYFTEYSIDADNINLNVWCNDSAGLESGWQTGAADYFSLYVLGGHATYETSGAQGYYYVTAFNNTDTDWNTTGVSPWLSAVGDGNSINTTTIAQDQGWFDFENITGEFMYVAMQFYARDISTHGGNDLSFTIESSDWGGTVLEPEIGNYWSWYESDLSDVITTEEGVNTLKINIRSFQAPNGTYVIDACRLYIQGYSGHLPGGDIFDLYAYSNTTSSYVAANATFRLLQHVKMLPVFTFNASHRSATIFYSFDFCINHSWVEGLTIQLSPFVAEFGDHRYLELRVHARYGLYGDPLVSDNVFMYHSSNASEWSECRFWVDLWFNRINASTTMGARINAYYYPMQDNSPWWLRWLSGSNWGVLANSTKQFGAFANILDITGNVSSTKNIDLVRVRVRLEANPIYWGGSPLEQYVEIRNNEVFDLTFSSKPFVGIQTPPWDETRLPAMQQGGFLGALWSGLQRLGAMIAEALGPSMLSFWNVFVSFLDTVAGWAGFPGGFSTLLSWVGSFWTWMVSSIGYLVTLLTTIFTTVLGPTLTKFLNLIASVFTQWISIVQTFFSFLDGTFTAGFHVWDELNIAAWITIGAILYPMYLIFLWDQKGMEAVIGQITFIKDVIFTLAHFFLAVAQWFVALIGRIIESIPVAE